MEILPFIHLHFIAHLIAIFQSRIQTPPSNIPTFDWTSLTASSSLKWHDCYTTSEQTLDETAQQVFSLASKIRHKSCALLALPLSYHNGSNQKKVHVPILRLRPLSPPNPHHHHRSTIFLLLSGAGNSRIHDLIRISSLTPLLDEIDPDHSYDFVTFDNRGFGFSEPSAKCSENEIEERAWEQRVRNLDGGGVLESADEEGMERWLVSMRAKGAMCRWNEGERDIRRFMSTAYAARDMLEILDLLPASGPGSHSSDQASKLQRLAMSYGTMVGQTFASLYPERVSRMVLDGAVDPNDWMGTWQMQHLLDTDASWRAVCQDCFAAKAKCALWREADHNSMDIEDRVSAYVEGLRKRPAYSVTDGYARLITYRDLKVAIYWGVMAASQAAPGLATTLDGLMRGHTNVSLDIFENLPSDTDCSQTPDSRATSNADAGMALNCGDEADSSNNSISHFKSYLSALEDQSSITAFIQGERKIRCLTWPIRPEWRYTGPFTSKSENGMSRLETPILFLGNKLDPMTPIHNSRALVEVYPGSVVLEQSCVGHCALASGVPNECIFDHLRLYFREGLLPEPGTVCESGCNLFDGASVDKTMGTLDFARGFW